MTTPEAATGTCHKGALAASLERARSPGELFEAARRAPADRKEDLARRTLGHALALVATARELAEAALIG